MARSTYVYVVTDELGPIAAFTTKHELRAWMEKTACFRVRITRLRDGGRGLPAELSYPELES